MGGRSMAFGCWLAAVFPSSGLHETFQLHASCDARNPLINMSAQPQFAMPITSTVYL